MKIVIGLVSCVFLASCISRQAFRVLPHAPSYLVRSPDSEETPFPEVLRRYNGFEPAHSSIDLRPLMELRIENAYYQPGSSRRGLNGFLGTEIARYRVRTDGLQLVSVQSMKGRPPNDTPVEGLISRAVATNRYYRLYFEIVFNHSNNSHGSVLLGADSKEQLDQLSAQLDHPETICNMASTHCTAFPEACSVSIEMRVVINGNAVSLLWGSLLKSVVGDHPQHLEVKRLYAGRLIPVQINPGDAGALRLPLLPGDHVAWK